MNILNYMIVLIKKLWDSLFKKEDTKKENDFKRKLEELKKRDPFTYKH